MDIMSLDLMLTDMLTGKMMTYVLTGQNVDASKEIDQNRLNFSLAIYHF